MAEVDAAHLQDDVVVVGSIAADFDHAEVVGLIAEDAVPDGDVLQDDVDIPKNRRDLRRHQWQRSITDLMEKSESSRGHVRVAFAGVSVAELSSSPRAPRISRRFETSTCLRGRMRLEVLSQTESPSEAQSTTSCRSWSSKYASSTRHVRAASSRVVSMIVFGSSHPIPTEIALATNSTAAVPRVRDFERRAVDEEATGIANVVRQGSNEANCSVTCAALLCSCQTGDYENGPCQMQ